MSEMLQEFRTRQKDVFAAFDDLTDKTVGGEFDRATRFYVSVQNMIDSGAYDSDDARVALFMMDAAENMLECKLTLPEETDLLMRRRLQNGINAIELH